MTIREILVEPQAIAWLPWAVSYFFFIGLAFSFVFVGLLISRIEKNLRHEFIAISLGLICAIVAPVALTADLHQPSRIANFYLNPTAWSWMAWGALFLPLFTMAVGGYFLCVLRQTIEPQRLPKWLQICYWGKLNMDRWTNVFRLLSLLFSGLILLYTTMEVFAVEARPLWHHYWLMPLILFSVLPTALYVCRVCVHWLGTGQVGGWYQRLSLVSLVVFIGCLIGLYLSSPQAAKQLHQLWHFSDLPLLLCFCLASLILLMMLPINRLSAMLTVIIALLFTWLFRWVLLIQVQSVAKYNALMNPYHLTWQIDGAIGILSVFSLWIFISVIFWHLFSQGLVSQHRVGGNHE